MVSRHQQNLGEGHWTAVKNILKYLRNSKDGFLVYGGEEELRVTGYCDASWQTDKDDSRSQPLWVFLLNGGAVTRKSLKQDTVVDSTCESEYIAACEASKEAIWMKNFIGDLGVVPTVQDPIEISCNNESVVALTKEPKDHYMIQSSAVALDGTLCLVDQDRLRPIIVDDLSKWETVGFSVQVHNYLKNRQKQTLDSMEEEDDWADADYRRAGVIRAVDFRRFGAMRSYESQLLNNALNGVSNRHMMSREDYALLINESIRDDLPEALKKKKKKKKKKKMEAEKKKINTDTKKRKKKMEGGECEQWLNQKNSVECWKIKTDLKKLIDDLIREDPEENTTVEGLREIYEKHGYEAEDVVAKARCERLEAAKAKARLEASKSIARNDCEQEAEAAEDALLL
ncbi:hypothetical protein Tco_0290500 [Tanacetum coccineum]